MCYIVAFWFLFLIDSFITMFSFIFFIAIWMSLLYIWILLFTVYNNLENNTYFSFNFVNSKYLDGYWFFTGCLFVVCMLIRLCLLLYFGSINFISFDLCKCIGYQWYWVYFLFGDNVIFSNLLLESDYYVGDMRLLQCNHNLLLLSLVLYKLWLSSVDVIHSFTISSLGLKVDCIPGRCNELTLFSTNSGAFYGQCSELCGVLHGFMPITVQFI